MSDNWMHLIPKDPLASPAVERLQGIVDLLSALRRQDGEPEIKESETPHFIAMGIDNVFCPHCGMAIMEWWSKAMGRWDGGRELAVSTPCCHRASSLNDLDYYPEVGFAVFSVRLMNPWGDLEPEEFRQVEAAFGMPVRLIWTHL